MGNPEENGKDIWKYLVAKGVEYMGRGGAVHHHEKKERKGRKKKTKKEKRRGIDTNVSSRTKNFLMVLQVRQGDGNVGDYPLRCGFKRRRGEAIFQEEGWGGWVQSSPRLTKPETADGVSLKNNKRGKSSIPSSLSKELK